VSIRDSAMVNQKRFSNVNHYARIPREVLIDATVSSDAKITYAVLALSTFHGAVAYVGQRLIGEILGVSQPTVSRRLAELEMAGHIRQAPATRGKRAHWELLSPVFGQKQGRATVVVSSPKGGRRYASVDIEEVA
jgi:DNA-binding MarR family transcriptional regulator